MLTFVVVVTHLGRFDSGNVVVVVLVRELARNLNSLFGDSHVLVVDGTNGRGRVDGGLVDVGGSLGEVRRVARGVNCLVDTNSLLVNWAATG